MRKNNNNSANRKITVYKMSTTLLNMTIQNFVFEIRMFEITFP